jgi:hypothetical protein
MRKRSADTGVTGFFRRSHHRGAALSCTCTADEPAVCGQNAHAPVDTGVSWSSLGNAFPFFVLSGRVRPSPRVKGTSHVSFCAVAVCSCHIFYISPTPH